MLIGLVGLPNSGKSTALKALTLADVQIANYPFTTIEPNQAVGHVIRECACKKQGVKCNPHNSTCIDGNRWIPVKLLDVAGLVPGAHEGKGLGNQFLDDLRQADGLIHVLDSSGLTDTEGKQRPADDPHDPEENVKVLEEEIAPELGVRGGGLQLVAIEGDKVIVVMQGACAMCSNLQTTVNDFVEKKLREEVDENIVVEVGG